MKLKFDSTLDYQLEAIKSVTDHFEGLPARSSHDLVALKFGRKLYPVLNLIVHSLQIPSKYHIEDSEWKYTSRIRIKIFSLGEEWLGMLFF